MSNAPYRPTNPQPRQHVHVKGDGIGMNVGGDMSGKVVGGDDLSRRTTKNNNGGRYLFAVIVIIAVVVMSFKVVPAISRQLHDAGLSADSTCHEFLDADPQTEQHAIVDIAMAKGLGGFGSPLALPAIQYACSGQPNEHLGTVIQKFAGQF
ncbi:MAG: hypothetical protein HOY79_43995 [Streptomyces sp.]|nr:hypothetical protein [Streptomyces sp.]